MPVMKLPLTGDEPADRLLEEDPLALLVGMLLDQQVPMEKAFHSPYELKERLGGQLDAAKIAAMDPDELRAVFTERPALHRFCSRPKANNSGPRDFQTPIISALLSAASPFFGSMPHNRSS